MERSTGRVRVWSAEEGSKSRSSVVVRVVSGECGSEAMGASDVIFWWVVVKR